MAKIKRTPEELEARRKYVRSWRAQKIAARPKKEKPKPIKTDMKYDCIVNEPLNQGLDYREYLEVSRKRSKPAKQARLKQLKAERAERIKKYGRLKVPKMKWTVAF